MKILITGGAGFIGSHTADALLKEGHDVRILDNFAKPVHQEGIPEYLAKEAEVVEGDVRDKEAWRRALRGIEAVYHLAAYQDYLLDFSKFFFVNSVGTALLYEVAVEERMDLRKVILASSQAVYGEGKYLCKSDNCEQYGRTGKPLYPSLRSSEQLKNGQWDHRCPGCGEILAPQLTDESVVNPQNQYALSKYTQELIALNLGKSWGIPTVALRYSIVQGPRQSFHNAYSGVCRIFCLSFFLGKRPPIYEDGRQLRDFVNIWDVVSANLLVLEKPEADFQAFNVGGGVLYTVMEFVEIVKRICSGTMEPKVSGEYRYGDTRHIGSEISKLRMLGWKPEFSPERSVKDYVEWLRGINVKLDNFDQAQEQMREMLVVRPVGRD